MPGRSEGPAMVGPPRPSARPGVDAGTFSAIMSFRDELYERYDTHPSHADVGIRGDVMDVYRHYLEGWLPGALDVPILDIGCGNGRFLRFLQDRGFRNVTGVDRSPVQVRRSREHAPGAEVLLGDAGIVLRDRNATFGAILAIDVLEHLTRDELFEHLELILQGLRPGGALIAQVPNGASPFFGAIRHGDLTHELAFTEDSLRHALQVSGFQDVEFRECGPVSKNLTGAIRRAIWRILRSFIRAWNLVETGTPGSVVQTRVALVRATKST